MPAPWLRFMQVTRLSGVDGNRVRTGKSRRLSRLCGRHTPAGAGIRVRGLQFCRFVWVPVSNEPQVLKRHAGNRCLAPKLHFASGATQLVLAQAAHCPPDPQRIVE